MDYFLYVSNRTRSKREERIKQLYQEFLKKREEKASTSNPPPTTTSKVEETNKNGSKEAGQNTKMESKSKRGRHDANYVVEEFAEEEGDLIGIRDNADNSEEFEVEDIEKDDFEHIMASDNQFWEKDEETEGNGNKEANHNSNGTNDDSEDFEVEEIDEFDFVNKMSNRVNRTGSGSKEEVNEGDVAFKNRKVYLSSFEEEEEEEEGFIDDNDQPAEIELEEIGGVNLGKNEEMLGGKTKSTSKVVYGEADVAIDAKEGTCKSAHPLVEKEDEDNRKRRRVCEALGTRKSVLPRVQGKEDDTSKPTKRTRVCESEKDDIVRILMGSILDNGEIDDPDHKLEVKEKSPAEDPLPLKFRFGDESPVAEEKSEFEEMVDGLFSDLAFYKQCQEVGSLNLPVNDNENKDAPDCETNQVDRCNNGKHSLILDEQIGMRCIYCSCVLLEIRYVTPQFAPDNRRVSEREYSRAQNDVSILDGLQFKSPGENYRDSCNHMKGTVWDIIPGIRDSMYPHQQDGFEFLWRNIEGTINLHEIESPDSSGGGGCIISHAPGTGKTRLTIVFIETYLKLFPNCRPVIIAPASMLLTWEEEFKKWKVKFPFHNLNNPELSGNESITLKKYASNEVVRAMKVYSWQKEQSVLGVSYSLYEKLAGEKTMAGKYSEKGKRSVVNEKHHKWGKILLEFPGLVVLDEGHTPRNERSRIWNTLSKLQTGKRIILSGTPFQNNFNELNNTLHLVRPQKVDLLAKQDLFSESKRKYSRKGKAQEKRDLFCSTSGEISDEAIEKLKKTIEPFVHVHKGSILQENLPGLRETVVLLNTPYLQKHLSEIIDGSQSSFSFDFEHKVSLVLTHPSLIQYCSLSDEEKSAINLDQFEERRFYPEEGVKTRFIMELIRLSESMNEKVLIFSQYIHPLGLIKDQLKAVFDWDEGKEVLQMQGKMDQKQRQNVINVFNDPKSDVKVLLASTKCCSEGISLVGASRVVLIDVVWNPSVETQAISRAYRLGQKKVVYSYNLIASGTKEWDKYCRQAEKDRLSKLVFYSSSKEDVKRKENNAGLNDKVLEGMVGNPKLKDMFERIIYQPKDANL